MATRGRTRGRKRPGSRGRAPRQTSPSRPADRETQAKTILRRLNDRFPRAVTALRHENPFQLLIATILSAQCTDERVNAVTPRLFAAFPTAERLAAADRSEIERIIRPTGFFRMKAGNILACSAGLVARHGGEVPSSMDELIQLPGVGRKTANVVLGQAFGITSGIVVDTHVRRLSRRLGLTEADTPGTIEADLMDLLPPSDWIDTGSLLILHGRETCTARKPACAACILADICPTAPSREQSA